LAALWCGTAAQGCDVYDDERVSASSDASPGDYAQDGGDGNGNGGASDGGQQASCTNGPCDENCNDGKTNGTETDTDCGGPSCDPCGLGDDCERARDCDSDLCSPTRNVCIASCEDQDQDGYCFDVDSEDGNAHCWLKPKIDEDGDDYCWEDDPDDHDDGCYLTPSIDEDGDRVCAETDSDDHNENCIISTTDDDNDGYCAETDSDDDNSHCHETPLVDDDADGYCEDVDVEDDNPNCYVKENAGKNGPFDEDGDSYCAETDSDDANPYCNANTLDSDNDGECECQGNNCTWGDCDDSDIDKNHVDSDSDGVSTCEDDCADTNPLRFPRNTEVCDGVDNDCDSSLDDGDVDCGGDGSCYGDSDGDGISSCSDLCPSDSFTPTRLRFQWLSSSCSGNPEYRNFYLNGNLKGMATTPNPTDCVCDYSQIAELAINDLSGWNVSGSNIFVSDAFSDANEALTWMKVVIEYGNFSKEVCIQGDCGLTTLCQGSYCWTPGDSNTPLCDPITSNGYTTDINEVHADSDGDGVGAQCDCDDSADDVSPKHPELCGDALDNDCDLSIDEPADCISP
jgi:hypothetical protein